MIVGASGLSKQWKLFADAPFGDRAGSALHALYHPGFVLFVLWLVVISSFYLGPIAFGDRPGFLALSVIAGGIALFAVGSGYLAPRLLQRLPHIGSGNDGLEMIIIATSAIGSVGIVLVAIDRLYLSGILSEFHATVLRCAPDLVGKMQVERTPLLYAGYLTFSMSFVAATLLLIRAEEVRGAAAAMGQLSVATPIAFSMLYAGRMPILLLIGLIVGALVARRLEGRAMLPQRHHLIFKLMVLLAGFSIYNSMIVQHRREICVQMSVEIERLRQAELISPALLEEAGRRAMPERRAPVVASASSPQAREHDGESPSVAIAPERGGDPVGEPSPSAPTPPGTLPPRTLLPSEVAASKAGPPAGSTDVRASSRTVPPASVEAPAAGPVHPVEAEAPVERNEPAVVVALPAVTARGSTSGSIAHSIPETGPSVVVEAPARPMPRNITVARITERRTVTTDAPDSRSKLITASSDFRRKLDQEADGAVDEVEAFRQYAKAREEAARLEAERRRQEEQEAREREAADREEAQAFLHYVEVRLQAERIASGEPATVHAVRQHASRSLSPSQRMANLKRAIDEQAAGAAGDGNNDSLLLAQLRALLVREERRVTLAAEALTEQRLAERARLASDPYTDFKASIREAWNCAPQGYVDALVQVGLPPRAAIVLMGLSFYLTHGIMTVQRISERRDTTQPYWGVYQVGVLSPFLRLAAPSSDHLGRMERELKSAQLFGFFPSVWGAAYLDFGMLGGALYVLLWGLIAGLAYHATRQRLGLAGPLLYALSIGSILTSTVSGPLGVAHSALMIASFLVVAAWLIWRGRRAVVSAV